eukprot:6178660-Pleurochrysis_carterae.AAC.4
MLHCARRFPFAESRARHLAALAVPAPHCRSMPFHPFSPCRNGTAAAKAGGAHAHGQDGALLHPLHRHPRLRAHACRRTHIRPRLSCEVRHWRALLYLRLCTIHSRRSDLAGSYVFLIPPSAQRF